MNAIINTLTSLKPQDEFEGMLIGRMIAIHFQSMQLLANAGGCNNPDAASSYINSATKLMRVYNESLEALMRYRRKGEQKVVVQHVNVNDGGKAVIAVSMEEPHEQLEIMRRSGQD